MESSAPLIFMSIFDMQDSPISHDDLVELGFTQTEDKGIYHKFYIVSGYVSKYVLCTFMNTVDSSEFRAVFADYQTFKQWEISSPTKFDLNVLLNEIETFANEYFRH